MIIHFMATDKAYELDEIEGPFYCPREGGDMRLFVIVSADFAVNMKFICQKCGRTWVQREDSTWDDGDEVSKHKFENDEFWVRILKKNRSLFDIHSPFDNLKSELRRIKP